MLVITARAAVTMLAIFPDHAVLQRGPAVPVWGKGAMGEKVTVSVAGKSAHAVADDLGKWRVVLDKPLPDPIPLKIQFPTNN
jgi:sialate O-acetylesterase